MIITLVSTFYAYYMNIFYSCNFPCDLHCNRHFLPFGRTNFTPKSSLLLTRGSSLQLREPLPRLCSNLGSLITQKSYFLL